MAKRPYGVLVIHGFSARSESLGELESQLRALGLPTRLPTLRGHGETSPQALCGITWRDWLVDADAALEDLRADAEKTIIVGHSLGGLLALNLAADHGDVIDSLSLAAAAVQFASPLAPGRPLHFLVPLLRQVLTRWNVPPAYADQQLAQLDTCYRWTPADALLSLLEFGEVTRRRLPQVQVPTLIMQPRKDTIVNPKSAEIIYGSISTPPTHKRIVWFEKTDHGMFTDCESESAIRTAVSYVRERVGL